MFHLHLKMSAGCSFIKRLELIQHISSRVSVYLLAKRHTDLCVCPHMGYTRSQYLLGGIWAALSLAETKVNAFSPLMEAIYVYLEAG